MGNVTKDVYLNLDTRTESFETDKTGTKWLNLSFDASEHRFFNRSSSFGGAAVSLEVLQKLGLPAAISGSRLNFTEDRPAEDPLSTHRYILVSEGDVTYLAPSKFDSTTFTPPAESVDYLYIDRSAELDLEAIKKVSAYLDISPNTKLVIYLRNNHNANLTSLLQRASLIFVEEPSRGASFQSSATQGLDPQKIISISASEFSYSGISERVIINQIDTFTHLSVYSIASATILGAFILGKSVEDSLRMAKINVENSKLNSTLGLDKLQNLIHHPIPTDNLELIAASLVLPPKGILAADESGGSIKKKFANLGIEDTYDNRRDFRKILFTTPDLERYASGVILFDETARQTAPNGQNFTDYLISRRIIPGIKVDQGLEKFENSSETYTKGLEDLPTRLAEYQQMGLRFAKWRAAFEITLDESGNILTPSDFAIQENCRILAEYATDCQSAGLVPIVEPEVVYDGNYTIDQCTTATAKVLDSLFVQLKDSNVNLRACLLKVNMISSGKQSASISAPSEVGLATANLLRDHVPPELAGIVFLSGGQTVEQATANLSAVIKNGPFPWPVTFSFSRALQNPALEAWAGNNDNTIKAQKAFLSRLIANTDALEA